MKNSRLGFSLIELLVCLVIMMIVFGISMHVIFHKHQQSPQHLQQVVEEVIKSMRIEAATMSCPVALTIYHHQAQLWQQSVYSGKWQKLKGSTLLPPLPENITLFSNQHINQYAAIIMHMDLTINDFTLSAGGQQYAMDHLNELLNENQ